MKHRKQQPHSNKALFGLMLALLAVLIVVLVFRSRTEALPRMKSTPNSESETSSATAAAEEAPPAENSIAIPGYEGLTLAAGTREQTLSLPNPETNDCYFALSLYLADGTLLWESELIKPGESSEPLYLTRALDAGSYPEARLVYSCFTYDRHKTPLNGADMKLTLHVK